MQRYSMFLVILLLLIPNPSYSGIIPKPKGIDWVKVALDGMYATNTVQAMVKLVPVVCVSPEDGLPIVKEYIKGTGLDYKKNKWLMSNFIKVIVKHSPCRRGQQVYSPYRGKFR